MGDRPRCQSCGMPVQDGYYGTRADGSPEPEYCRFCYQDGAFTNPDLTAERMVERSVAFMSENLGYAEPEARRLSESVIPGLKRWRTK